MTHEQHYHLRPRRHVDYRDPSPDEDESPEGSGDDDIVITVSQVKRRTTPSPPRPLALDIDESTLGPIPFAVTCFDDLYRLSCICVDEGKMFKDCRLLVKIHPVLKELHSMIGLKSAKDALCNLILFEIISTTKNHWKHMVITGEPGIGKCLGVNTPVMMVDGTIKPVQSVVAGNLLRGDDGLPRQVLSTCEGIDRLYLVVQPHGSYVVTRNHIMSFVLVRDPIVRVLDEDLFRVEWCDAVKQTQTIDFVDNLPKKGHQVDMDLQEYLEKPTSWKDWYKAYRILPEATDRSWPLGSQLIESYDVRVHDWAIGEYYGFELSGNGRFLLGDGTVTHNTSIARIIARLLNLLGKTQSDEITVATPLNMISDYEGQTKTMVNNVVQEALGKSGIVLIDEAPALNDRMGRDSYGKKCIDMLMQLMDKYRETLVVIFAGYRGPMETNILNANEGLRRRIQWFIHIDPYTPDELHAIFVHKMHELGLTLAPDCNVTAEWFHAHRCDFPFSGGSVDNFIQKIRGAHIQKTFGQVPRSTVDNATVAKAFELYYKFIASGSGLAPGPITSIVGKFNK